MGASCQTGSDLDHKQPNIPSVGGFSPILVRNNGRPFDPAGLLATAQITTSDLYNARTPGTVYFAYMPDLNLLKVGFTTKRPVFDRIVQNLTWLPVDIYLVGMYSGTYGDELWLHAQLTPFRHRREWYQATPALWAALSDIRSRTPHTGGAA